MSATKDLLNEIRKDREARNANPDGHDWTDIKASWLAAAPALFDSVRAWLQEGKTGGLIEFEEEPVHLSEEHIGPYEPKSLVIRLGDPKVALVPISAVVVGAHGRVDVVCGAKKAMLLRVSSGSWVLRRPSGSIALRDEVFAACFAISSTD